MRRTRGIALLLAVTCCLPLSACSSDTDPDSPQDAASDPVSSSAPTDPPPTEVSWREKYSDEELRAYDAALGRWEEYEARSEGIWSAGRVTPAAEELFKQYFPAPNWQAQMQKLQTYENAEVRIAGLPTVLWSKGTRVKLGAGSGSVSIVQCVNYLTAQVIQYDEVVDKEPVFDKPVRRTVVLGQPEDEPWLIFELKEPVARTAKRCTAGGA